MGVKTQQNNKRIAPIDHDIFGPNNPFESEHDFDLFYGIVEEFNRTWTTIKNLNTLQIMTPAVITLHDEDGKLLLGELAALAQVLHNRLWQKEEEPGADDTTSYAFSHTSLFPVRPIESVGIFSMLT